MIFKENRFSVKDRLARTVFNAIIIMLCIYIPVMLTGVIEKLWLAYAVGMFIITVQYVSLFVIIPKIIKKNFKDST